MRWCWMGCRRGRRVGAAAAGSFAEAAGSSAAAARAVAFIHGGKRCPRLAIEVGGGARRRQWCNEGPKGVAAAVVMVGVGRRGRRREWRVGGDGGVESYMEGGGELLVVRLWLCGWWMREEAMDGRRGVHGEGVGGGGGC